MNIEVESLEREFYAHLMEMDYVSDKGHYNYLVQKAKEVSASIPHYSNWPNDPLEFWNAEAMLWKNRISPDMRKGVQNELRHLKENNLDLASGSFSYIPTSLAIDFSEEMIHLNDCKQKLVANLEKPLPVNRTFDNATMVFGANYVKNLQELFFEVNRVLHDDGKFVIVQSADPVFKLHYLHYRNSYKEPELRIMLRRAGFDVESQTKKVYTKKLNFITANKISSPMRPF